MILNQRQAAYVEGRTLDHVVAILTKMVAPHTRAIIANQLLCSDDAVELNDAESAIAQQLFEGLCNADPSLPELAMNAE